MAVSCLEQRLPPLDPEYLPFGPGGLPPWAGVLQEEDVRSRTWAGYAKYQRNAEPGADEAGGLEGLLADVLGSNDNNGPLGIANAPQRVPSSFNSNEESFATSSVAHDLQAPSAPMSRVISKRLPSYLTSSQDPSPSDGLGMHTAMSLCSTDFASPMADGEPGSSVCASPYRSWNERVSQDQPLRTFGGSESFCSDFAKTIIESKEDELPEFVTPGIEEPNWRTFDHGSFGSDIAASTRPGSFSGKEGMLNLMMGPQAGGLEDDFLSMIGNTQNKGAFCSYARPDRDDIVATTLGASSSNMPFSLQGQPQVAPMQQRPALGHLPRRIPTKELNDDSHDMATLAAQAMALTAPPPSMRSDEPRGWIPEVLSSQQTGPAAFSRHMYSNPLEAAQLPQPGGQAQRKGPPGLHPASITAAEPSGFGLEDAEALRQAREAALENMLPARILCGGEQPLQQRRQQQNFDQQLQHIQRQQQELEQQRQQIQQMQQQQQRLEQQRQQLQHQQQLMQQQSYARGMEAAARGPAFQHRSQREDGAPGAVAGGRRAAHAAQAAKALQAVQAAQGAHAAQAWSADALRQQAIAQAVANAAANGQYFGTPVPGAVPGFAPQVAPGSGQHRGMAAQAPQVPGQITTLMIKNLHRNISRNALIREVHRLGLEDRYDFLHLPMAFGTGRNQGFAFINFKDAETATEFSNLFINPQPVVPGEKPWKVAPAEVQGYQANVAMASSQKMRRVRKRCNRPLVLAQGGTENEGQAEAEDEVDYDDGDDYYGAMAAFPGDGYFQQGIP